MGKLITMSTHTILDIPAERVLEAAKGTVERVLLLGFKADGELYFASSTGDKCALLWLVESFKSQLITGDFEEM